MATWDQHARSDYQSPVYLAVIEGSSTRFSTDFVRSPQGPTETLLMIPTPFGLQVDAITGQSTTSGLQVELMDEDEKVSNWLGTLTLVNRKITVYAGFRELVEADYQAVWTGRIRSLALSDDGITYRFSCVDLSTQLDNQIMTKSTENRPTLLIGNPVNLFWSICTGIFDTGHPQFPLDYVSADTDFESAPTGIGIAEADMDAAGLISQRDSWHKRDVAAAYFEEPTEGRGEFEDNFFNAFHCFLVIRALGQLGIRFFAPLLPTDPAETIDSADLIQVDQWRRDYQDHLTRLRIYSTALDEDPDDDDVLIYNFEDEANEALTGERVTYEVRTKWIRRLLDGAKLAAEIGNRIARTYVPTPATIRLRVTMRKQVVQRGDTIRVTSPLIPALGGGMGVVDQDMLVLNSQIDYRTAAVQLTCIILPEYRLAKIAPDTQVPYGSASPQERIDYCFYGDPSNLVGGTDEGYRTF